MADVKIRNLNDWIVESLRVRAQNAGHSLEQELRQVLEDSASAPRRAAIERLAILRANIKEKYGTFSDSTALIRADRDERG